MNKKAVMLLVVVVIVASLVMVGTIIGLSVKYKSKDAGTNYFVGEREFEIVKTALDGEKALLYIDLAAKYASEQTAYELGQYGGIASNSSCGRYGGYNLWQNQEKTCFPDQTSRESNFSFQFNRNLDPFLKKFLMLGIELPVENYHIILPSTSSGTEIRGFATQNIILSANDLMSRGLGKFEWPTHKNTISSCFGYRGCTDSLSGERNAGSCEVFEFNPGIDIETPKNKQVTAAKKGTVVEVDPEWGKVVIDHEDGFRTEYLHMQNIQVKKEDKLQTKKPIGETGDVNPGNPISPRLHFRLKINIKESTYNPNDGEYVNPVPYFAKSTSLSFNRDALSCSGKADLTYSIKPSFRTEIPYSFRNYKTINTLGTFIASSCAAQSAKEDCAKDTIKSPAFKKFNDKFGFVWAVGEDCDSGLWSLYSILTRGIRDCLDAPELNGYCTIDFSGDYTPGDYTFRFNRGMKKFFVNLESPETQLEFKDSFESPLQTTSSPGTNTPIDTFSLEIKIKNNRKIKNIKSDSSSIGINNNKIYLYKDGGSVSFISSTSPSTFGSPVTKRENYLRFCVREQASILAKDGITKTYANHDSIIRFGMGFDIIPPPPITSLSVTDKVTAENAVILEWGKVFETLSNGQTAEVEDLHHYNIYCDDTAAPDSISFALNNKIPTASVFPADNQISIKFALDMCGNNKIEDGNQYSFAITSVDTSGNEEKASALTAIAVAKGDSVTGPYDDISPSLVSGLTFTAGSVHSEEAVTNQQTSQEVSNIKKIIITDNEIHLSWTFDNKNQDLTSTDDFAEYKIFYRVGSAVPAFFTTTPSDVNEVYLPSAPIITKSVVLQRGRFGAQSGETVHLAVVAVDNTGNFIGKSTQFDEEFEDKNPIDIYKHIPMKLSDDKKHFAISRTLNSIQPVQQTTPTSSALLNVGKKNEPKITSNIKMIAITELKSTSADLFILFTESNIDGVPEIAIAGNSLLNGLVKEIDDLMRNEAVVNELLAGNINPALDSLKTLLEGLTTVNEKQWEELENLEKEI